MPNQHEKENARTSINRKEQTTARGSGPPQSGQKHQQGHGVYDESRDTQTRARPRDVPTHVGNDRPPIGAGTKNIPSIGEALDFQLDEDEDEEDAGEEKKLMAILLKLKSAKEHVCTNKKRKHCEKVVEVEISRHATTVQAIVHKFNSKRSAVFNGIQTEVTGLHVDLVALQKGVDAHRRHCSDMLVQRRGEMQRVLGTIHQAICNDIAALRSDYQAELRDSIDYARSQVQYKLRQLEAVVAKADNSDKDDKMAKLIQSVVASA